MWWWAWERDDARRRWERLNWHGPIMSTQLNAANRNVRRFVDDTPSAALPDLDSIAKGWARMILDHSHGLTQRQRERLRDIARPDRLYFSRSALNVLMELAAFATPTAATWGAEAIRGSIVGRLDIPLPTWSEAFHDEECATHAANLEQMRWGERRTQSEAEALCESFNSQIFATRIAADAVWKHMATGTRSIVVARR